MLKATKLTFAAMLLAGSCGLAIAQGTSGGSTGNNSGGAEGSGVSTDRPVNNDRLSTQGTAAPSGGAQMQQKNTNMPTQAGPNESGTAKDTAGTATQRDPAKQKQ